MKLIMNYIKFLYYRYYKFQVKVGNADVAPYSSVLIIACIMMLYCFDFFIWIGLILPPLPEGLLWKMILTIFLFQLIIFYLLLLHKGKYKRIIACQEAIDKKRKSYIPFLFPLLAFFLFIGGFALKIIQNARL